MKMKNSTLTGLGMFYLELVSQSGYTNYASQWVGLSPAKGNR